LPPEELSPAQIQGYLLGYKRDPILAVEHVREWLERERELKAEKEERERQRRQKLAEMASKAKVAKDIPSFA
jgi:chaperone BCS1